MSFACRVLPSLDNLGGRRNRITDTNILVLIIVLAVCAGVGLVAAVLSWWLTEVQRLEPKRLREALSQAQAPQQQ